MNLLRPPAINLARRPFRNNSVYYGVFITCFALLLVASGYNVYDFMQTGESIGRQELVRAERQQKYLELRGEVENMKKEVSSLDLTTLNAKSTFANGLILSRLFSWSTLFDRIEDIIPPHVRIRSIRPSISTKGIEIQIDGMAQAPEDLYQFEQELVNSNYFSGVYPVSENSKESRGEINFDLAMNYVPAGKTSTATASDAAPATPTAGLPQPPAEQEPAAAGPEPSPEGAPAQSAPAQSLETASAPSSPPQAAAVTAPVPQGAQPTMEPAEQAPAPPPQTDQGQPLSKPNKPPREMTNKEFIDWGGQERFIRIRGKLHPIADSVDSALGNEEFINKHGMAEFLKVRGGLPATEQRSVVAPPAEVKP